MLLTLPERVSPKAAKRTKGNKGIENCIRYLRSMAQPRDADFPPEPQRGLPHWRLDQLRGIAQGIWAEI